VTGDAPDPRHERTLSALPLFLGASRIHRWKNATRSAVHESGTTLSLTTSRHLLSSHRQRRPKHACLDIYPACLSRRKLLYYPGASSHSDRAHVCPVRYACADPSSDSSPMRVFSKPPEHFFSPRYHEHIPPHARRVFASSFYSSPPGDRSALHCCWNAIATQSIRIISVQERGILPRPEEQSLTCGCQSGSVEDQPQCPGL